ncbi:hypothetical protein HOLDEFILI_00124, partial [Holdemania filiformis DSM 12042]
QSLKIKNFYEKCFIQFKISRDSAGVIKALPSLPLSKKKKAF